MIFAYDCSSTKHDAKSSGRAASSQCKLWLFLFFGKKRRISTRVEFENFFNLIKIDEPESFYETRHDVTRVLENIEKKKKKLWSKKLDTFNNN